MSSFNKIHFISLVFNSIESLKKQVQSIPEEANWTIVEGAVECVRDLAWTRRFSGGLKSCLHNNLRSIDGSSELVDSLTQRKGINAITPKNYPFAGLSGMLQQALNTIEDDWVWVLFPGEYFEKECLQIINNITDHEQINGIRFFTELELPNSLSLCLRENYLGSFLGNSYGALRIWKQPAGGTFCIDTDPMHLEENSTGKPIGEKCLKGKDLIKYGIHVSNNLFEGCNPNNWIKLLGSRFITYESWLDIKNQSLSPKEMAANFLKRENSIGLYTLKKKQKDYKPYSRFSLPDYSHVSHSDLVASLRRNRLLKETDGNKKISRIWETILEKSRNQKVAFLGAGKFTYNLFNHTSIIKHHLNIYSIFDDNAAKNSTVNNFPVKKPKKEEKENFDLLLISTDTITDKLKSRAQDIWGQDTEIICLENI